MAPKTTLCAEVAQEAAQQASNHAAQAAEQHQLPSLEVRIPAELVVERKKCERIPWDASCDSLCNHNVEGRLASDGAQNPALLGQPRRAGGQRHRSCGLNIMPHGKSHLQRNRRNDEVRPPPSHQTEEGHGCDRRRRKEHGDGQGRRDALQQPESSATLAFWHDVAKHRLPQRADAGKRRTDEHAQHELELVVCRCRQHEGQARPRKAAGHHQVSRGVVPQQRAPQW
mmetsp:Transcript_105340/g.304717  ORF Transcript_105340/g.304717 Transcript_105340/m.304717 type:complete len:227 (+) Transcript_105340:741-1421(+)